MMRMVPYQISATRIGSAAVSRESSESSQNPDKLIAPVIGWLDYYATQNREGINPLESTRNLLLQQHTT